MKNKERPRSCHKPEETKKAYRINAMQYPRLNLQTGNQHEYKNTEEIKKER